MTIKKRRLWLGILMFFTLAGSLLIGNPSQAHAAMSHQNAPSQQKHASDDNLTYYGADLQTMTAATGIDFQHPNTIADGGPWPQATDNYCFPSVVQAMVNYADLKRGLSMRYPTQNDQGPASGDPADETEGQILYDMDHHMIPPDGPLQVVGSGKDRRPYALSNIAYDFGGDPRTQAVATAYETPGGSYHEHIFHNGPQAATLGIAKALALYSEPVIALVNHGEHSVLVAGVWATGNPLIDDNVQIDSLAIYNPWDQKRFGTYLSTGYYARVSYNDWINASGLPSPWTPSTPNTWFARPYAANGNLDPDPSIGIYQAGAGTSNPNAHHWIDNYVIIERDYHFLVDANFTFDENDHIMLKP